MPDNYEYDGEPIDHYYERRRAQYNHDIGAVVHDHVPSDWFKHVDPDHVWTVPPDFYDWLLTDGDAPPPDHSSGAPSDG